MTIQPRHQGARCQSRIAHSSSRSEPPPDVALLPPPPRLITRSGRPTSIDPQTHVCRWRDLRRADVESPPRVRGHTATGWSPRFRRSVDSRPRTADLPYGRVDPRQVVQRHAGTGVSSHSNVVIDLLRAIIGIHPGTVDSVHTIRGGRRARRGLTCTITGESQRPGDRLASAVDRQEPRQIAQALERQTLAASRLAAIQSITWWR